VARHLFRLIGRYKRFKQTIGVKPDQGERGRAPGRSGEPKIRSGAEGDRTPGLRNANPALSQLSYSPTWISSCHIWR
jgi:hypothetical protein